LDIEIDRVFSLAIQAARNEKDAWDNQEAIGCNQVDQEICLQVTNDRANKPITLILILPLTDGRMLSGLLLI
jgi:hypothetical protein